jgi:cytochrome c556
MKLIRLLSPFNHVLRISVLCLAGVVTMVAADKPPKYTVQEIMKAVFKGEDSTHKRIVKGTATPSDYDKLVEYLTALPLNDPPQGDAADWKKKSDVLLDAAVALKAHKPDALSQYNKAVNCQACHRIYRPD